MADTDDLADRIAMLEALADRLSWPMPTREDLDAAADAVRFAAKRLDYTDRFLKRTTDNAGATLPDITGSLSMCLRGMHVTAIGGHKCLHCGANC